MTTPREIRTWIDRGKDQDAKYVIVMCDGFDHSDYPVFVPADKNIHEKVAKCRGMNMQRLMEVYWLGGDIEQQLAATRSFTYAPEDQL